MAYQNVGKPRIFIDYLQYAQAIGLVGYYDPDIHSEGRSPKANFMNPLKPCSASTYPSYGNTADTWWWFATREPLYGMNFSGLLGHNFGGIPICPRLKAYQADWQGYDAGQATPTDETVPGTDEYYWGNDNGFTEIINAVSLGGGYIETTFNGFSLWKHDEISRDMVFLDDGTWANHFTVATNGLALDEYGSTAGSASILTNTTGLYTTGGVFVCGRYFDFEHSPDLKLTIEKEFDGVKKQKTIGGADVSNTTYLGPPHWPLSGNVWNLTEPNPGYPGKIYAGGHLGRRKWKLKFSMLSDRISESDTGLFPSTTLPSTLGVDTSDAAGYTEFYDYGNDDTYDRFSADFWTDSSFMGLVFQKTMGFTLPFIFQPDSNNSSADQFAICKIDNKSLKITQTSFKKYDISLTIREIW